MALTDQTDQKNVSPYLHFRFEGRLAKILGRQSVSTANGAVFELVKNGYDADAELSRVIFEDINKGKDVARIRIIDNGDGMTKEDIENKFMVVATGTRTRETKSKQGRRVVGEKGIGRFAMESLSKRTTILSYPKDEAEGYKLKINWERYEVDGVTFDQVGNEFSSFKKEDPKKQGIEIILEGLRHDWDLKKIDRLSSQLGNLISPEGFETNLDFDIKISALEFGINEESVKSKLLTKAMYKMKATLRDNKINVTIWEKGKQVNSDELVRDEISPVSMKCGSTTYILYGFPRGYGDEEQNEYEKYYGMSYEGKLLDFLDLNHGIRIYKDGFRMRPYGEEGNDWTDRGEAARKRSGVIPNISLIGWVNLSSENNPNIISTSTREKLIEDENFEDLKDFVKNANNILDSFCNKRRVEKRKEEKKNLPEQIESIAKKIADLELEEELKPRQKLLVRDLKFTAQNALEFVDEVTKEKERLMTKLEARRNLATVGLTTGLVAHEVRRDLADILAISADFRENLQQKNLSKEELFDKTMRLYSASLFVSDYMSLVRSFTSALRSKDPAFRKKIHINLREYIGNLNEKIKPLLDRFNIKLDYEKIPKNIQEFYMFEADFQSVFINLITNSLKAIQRQRKLSQDPEIKLKQNKINIELSNDPKTTYLQIVVSDDGPGVNPVIAQKIFDPFVSDNTDEDEWVSGSGLGLPFVKEILESYGGDIQLIKPEPGKGASFLLKLRWDELLKK